MCSVLPDPCYLHRESSWAGLVVAVVEESSNPHEKAVPRTTCDANTYPEESQMLPAVAAWYRITMQRPNMPCVTLLAKTE